MKQIIRQFHTERFTVTVEAQDECDLDLSWDESGRVSRQLDKGKLVAFCVKASVTYRGRELATDYLGNCIYKSPRAFMDHRGIRNYVPPGGKAGQCGSYFSDMVRTVISEARRALAEMQRVKVRA